MLGGWAGCVAKLALGSQHPGTAYEPLAGGPAAARGTLAHRVIEQWTKGTGPNEPDALFAVEYERLRDQLRGDPARAQFADLAEVFGAAEWSGFRAWVLRRCEGARPRAGRRLSDRRSTGTTKEIDIGVEVPLTSEALRLRGRADRIRRVDKNTYEIRDYKSGAVLGEDGEINGSIALQLQAYGLMFLESNPSAELLLIVDTGDEHRVAFDHVARNRARETIEALMATVPAAGMTPMNSIAKTGSDCQGCVVRHLCQAYFQRAPEWWLTYPRTGARIANDSWGTVIAVAGGASWVDVTMTDAANRRVRIDRLDLRHSIERSAIGNRVWFFGLEGSGPGRDFKGQRYHSRVFHELPRDSYERRAWSMQCFERQSEV
jgi:RecB family exonuclease